MEILRAQLKELSQYSVDKSSSVLQKKFIFSGEEAVIAPSLYHASCICGISANCSKGHQSVRRPHCLQTTLNGSVFSLGGYPTACKKDTILGIILNAQSRRINTYRTDDMKLQRTWNNSPILAWPLQAYSRYCLLVDFRYDNFMNIVFISRRYRGWS